MSSDDALSAASLREAAIAHLARFAASESGLMRVLERRIQRWSRHAVTAGTDPDAVRQRQQQARHDSGAVIAELLRLRLLDDTVFAESRARALSRAGRSRRAISAHLANRGIDAERIVQAVRHAQSDTLDDAAQTEFAAALMHARKRRLGPFALPSGDADADRVAPDPAVRQRALAALARAGFSHDVALSALDTDLESAEALINRLRGS